MQEDSYVIKDVSLETALQGISTYTGTVLDTGQSASNPLMPAQLKTSSGFGNFKIVQQGTIDLNRPAGDDSVSIDVATPSGANALLSYATLANASPLFTYPLPHIVVGGASSILWQVRALYDPGTDSATGVIRFFNDAFDAGVIAQAYDVSITYYLFNIQSST